MHARSLKYITPLLVYALAILAFTQHGIYCWFGLIYAWVVIPFAELFIKPDERNMSVAEEELAKKDEVYDWMLYAAVILLYPTLFVFLFSMKETLTTPDLIARIATMGLLCGTFGINVGHELGHRWSRFEQTLARMLLLTSQYMHFYIEHNRGHHKRVATPDDPSSARYGEWVYGFYCRSIIFSYFSAWNIANNDVKKLVRRGGKRNLKHNPPQVANNQALIMALSEPRTLIHHSQKLLQRKRHMHHVPAICVNDALT